MAIPSIRPTSYPNGSTECRKRVGELYRFDILSQPPFVPNKRIELGCGITALLPMLTRSKVGEHLIVARTIPILSTLLSVSVRQFFSVDPSGKSNFSVEWILPRNFYSFLFCLSFIRLSKLKVSCNTDVVIKNTEIFFSVTETNSNIFLYLTRMLCIFLETVFNVILYRTKIICFQIISIASFVDRLEFIHKAFLFSLYIYPSGYHRTQTYVPIDAGFFQREIYSPARNASLRPWSMRWLSVLENTACRALRAALP